MVIYIDMVKRRDLVAKKWKSFKAECKAKR